MKNNQLEIRTAYPLPILTIVGHDPEMADFVNPDGAIHKEVLLICGEAEDGRRFTLDGVWFDVWNDVKAEAFATKVANAGSINRDLWSERGDLSVYGSSAWEANEQEEILTGRRG